MHVLHWRNILDHKLLRAIIDNGLLQFGWFAGQPFRHNLHMLPSYPVLLRDLSYQLRQSIDVSQFDHLLCAYDSLPLAVIVSQATGIPLVYSQGSDAPPARDLVGAYDVGHPALLIANTWNGRDEALALIRAAGRVGLDVVQVQCALLTTANSGELPVRSLLNLSDVVDDLVANGMLPVGQAEAVKKWM